MVSRGPSSSHVSLNGPMSESGLMSIREVEERIHQLLSENASLRTTLQQNNTYMRQLSVTLIEWQDEVVRVQKTYHQKFEKAKEVVNKLKQENAELKRRIDTLPSSEVRNPGSQNHTSPAFVGSSQIQDGCESLDGYVLVAAGVPPLSELPIESQEDVLPSYDSLFRQSTFDREASESFVRQLQRETDSLRTQLAAETESNRTKQIALTQTQSQLDRLMVDFQELSKKWAKEKEVNLKEALIAEASSSPSTTASLEANQRCSELEGQLSSVTSRLAKAEEIALAKQIRNSELETEILRLQKSLETLDVLKAQVELYQADFEAEREARQQLAGEKETLTQEIRVLKRQLEETSCNGGASTSSATARPAEEELATVSAFVCPKCSFKYPTNEALNNHLDVCLTQHMFP